jgi:hypothetical protein
MRRLLLAFALVTAVPAAATAAPDQKQLAQGRVDTAAKVFGLALSRWQSGQSTVDDVAAWSLRWLSALRDQPVKGAALKKALAEHRDRMKAVEAASRDRVNAGVAATIELESAHYFLVEAELWVLRGK